MDDYAEIFANQTSKVVALSYSIITTLILTPLMYSIILFERDDHRRTLINQVSISLSVLLLIRRDLDWTLVKLTRLLLLCQFDHF